MKYQVALKKMLVQWMIGLPIAYAIGSYAATENSGAEALVFMLLMIFELSGIAWSWSMVGKWIEPFKMYIPVVELWFFALFLKIFLLVFVSVAFYPVLIYTIVRAKAEYKSVADKKNMNFVRWIWYAPKEVQCEKPEAARAHAEMEEIYSAEHSRYLDR